MTRHTSNPASRSTTTSIESLVARSGMASIFRATDTAQRPHRRHQDSRIPRWRPTRHFSIASSAKQEIGEKLDHPGVMKVFTDDRPQPHLHGHGVGGRPAAARRC